MRRVVGRRKRMKYESGVKDRVEGRGEWRSTVIVTNNINTKEYLDIFRGD